MTDQSVLDMRDLEAETNFTTPNKISLWKRQQYWTIDYI